MPSPLASPLDAAAGPLGPMPPPPSLLDQAGQQYPVLKNQQYGYVENFKPNAGFLEFWPPGEGGEGATARPTQLPMGQPGLEIRDPKTRPIDVLGDIVSHSLVHTDPVIKNVYEKFKSSMTPEQNAILAEQYQYAQQNEGEKRPFEEWKETAGLPGFFRGYAFDQWPKDFTDKVYTPEQKNLFDGMMSYLRGDK